MVLYPNILIEKLKNISKDFNINILDNQGYTILVFYLLNTKKVDIKVIKKLKDLGADINKPKNNSKIHEILHKNCNLLDQIIHCFGNMGFPLLSLLILVETLSGCKYFFPQ